MIVQRYLADVIKFTNQMTLTQEDYPGLSGWDRCNHMNPKMWKNQSVREMW